MARLRSLGYSNEFTLAYQSKVGPVPWLRPYTDDKIVELGAKGVNKMVVVPVSFVSEHIETLEEIDVEYKELAEANGIDQWERVPALGLEPDFIEDLASAVRDSPRRPRPAGLVEEALPRTSKPLVSDINEGRPVSLRVVNDLVQLRAKEEAIEYGPVNYQASPETPRTAAACCRKRDGGSTLSTSLSLPLSCARHRCAASASRRRPSLSTGG
eukprot:1717016-Prymnesium_polylepis.2